MVQNARLLAKSCTTDHFAPLLGPILVHSARLAVKSGDVPPEGPTASPFPLHPQLALQFGLGVHVEFGVDVLGMAANGVFREVERLGDVGTGASLAQEQQHLGLAGGEAVCRGRPVASALKGVGRGFSLVLLKVGEHECERGVAQVEEQHGEREQAEKGRAVVEHPGGLHISQPGHGAGDERRRLIGDARHAEDWV